MRPDGDDEFRSDVDDFEFTDLLVRLPEHLASDPILPFVVRRYVGREHVRVLAAEVGISFAACKKRQQRYLASLRDHLEAA